jgi:hypothetical protein
MTRRGRDQAGALLRRDTSVIQRAASVMLRRDAGVMLLRDAGVMQLLMLWRESCVIRRCGATRRDAAL